MREGGKLRGSCCNLLAVESSTWFVIKVYRRTNFHGSTFWLSRHGPYYGVVSQFHRSPSPIGKRTSLRHSPRCCKRSREGPRRRSPPQRHRPRQKQLSLSKRTYHTHILSLRKLGQLLGEGLTRKRSEARIPADKTTDARLVSCLMQVMAGLLIRKP